MSAGQDVMWFVLCAFSGAFPAFMLGMRTKSRDLERRMARSERRLEDIDSKISPGPISTMAQPLNPPDKLDKRDEKATIRLLQRMQDHLNRR